MVYNAIAHKRYRDLNKNKRSNYNKVRLEKLRDEIYNHYCNGDIKCQCCGERHIEFLSLDHINGDGSNHRKMLKSEGTTLFTWIIKNNFPNIFRVLCMNCNTSYGFYGYCPHQNLSDGERDELFIKKYQEKSNISKISSISPSDSIVTLSELKEVMRLKEII